MSWRLVYEGFDPAQERLRETLCTLGNGYFATRGAGSEADADEVRYPGTYLAGGYNRLTSEIAGQEIENEDLVNFPNWLSLRLRVEDGPWFEPRAVELLAYRQELDLRSGLLRREIRFRDGQGRMTRLSTLRFVHMGRMHLAGEELTVVAENWSGLLTVRAALDGRVRNDGVPRYRGLRDQHLVPLRSDGWGKEGLLLQVETHQSRLQVAQAARIRFFRDGGELALTRELLREAGYVAHQVTLPLRPRQELRIEKLVALYTSRDRAISESALAARHAVEVAPAFDQLLEEQSLAWGDLWSRCDLDLHRPEGDHTARVLRLHIFHLLQTASYHSIDLDTGVPARGWHGEAYRGHIFWDELFIFPYLNLRIPDLTRALLRYRYRRLPMAREMARAAGYRGAMFPWQSGSDGREESQRIHLNPRSGRWIPDLTWRQRHINCAIAYNTWHYYQTTGDTEFLYYYGAELLLEIARFWASYACLNEETGRYEIRGVVGPDEFHTGYLDRAEPGIDNNAYTNIMAVWCLCRGMEVLQVLPQERREELTRSLRLTEEELEHWDAVSRQMKVPIHNGLILQYDGYERLEELDWEGYRRRYGDIHRIDRILEAEGKDPNRYKVSKQADVLMLFYLLSSDELGELFARLGYSFDPGCIRRNIEYYRKRTSHGSTLSRVVLSWVLARSDRPRSWRLFRLALDSDISDVQGGTTPEGIHLGAMAGTVDLVQRAYTGIEIRADILRFSPLLPRDLERYTFNLRYRRQLLRVEITPGLLRVTSRWVTAEAITVAYKELVRVLGGGETVEFPLTSGEAEESSA